MLMTTQIATPLTIKEYAAGHDLSKTTVRRRIRAGGLDARIEHGRYFIYGQNGVHSGDEAPTQNGQVDTQIEQASDKEDSQESNAVFSQQIGQRSYSPLRPHRIESDAGVFVILVFLTDIVHG